MKKLEEKQLQKSVTLEHRFISAILIQTFFTEILKEIIVRQKVKGGQITHTHTHKMSLF